MTKENLCVFYASKYHLALILSKYLQNKNIEEYEIENFLQNNITEEMEILKEKYKPKFNNALINNFIETSNKSTNQLNPKNKIIIINGEIDYIKNINQKISQELISKNLNNQNQNNLKNTNSKNQNIQIQNLNNETQKNYNTKNTKNENFNDKKLTIINCFNFEEQAKFMEEILKKNDKILFTNNEKTID